jgi:hypothetical protein
MFRFSLAISASGVNLDIRGSLANLSARTNQLVAERVLEPVLHTVDKFFSKYVNQLTDVLDPTSWSYRGEKVIDEDVAEVILECPLIEELIEYGLRGLERLKQLLKQLILKAWRRAEAKDLNGEWAIKLLANSKSAKILLDQVISAIDRGNLCAREGGAPEIDEIEDMVNRLVEGLPPGIRVPLDGDPYETFRPVAFESAYGIPVPPVQVPPEDRSPRPFRIGDCMRSSGSALEYLKAFGYQAQLSRDLRHASNVDPARAAEEGG